MSGSGMSEVSRRSLNGSRDSASVCDTNCAMKYMVYSRLDQPVFVDTSCMTQIVYNITVLDVPIGASGGM